MGKVHVGIHACIYRGITYFLSAAIVIRPSVYVLLYVQVIVSISLPCLFSLEFKLVVRGSSNPNIYTDFGPFNLPICGSH